MGYVSMLKKLFKTNYSDDFRYLRCDGSNSFVSPCPGHIYFVPTTECQSDNAQTTMTPPTTLSLPPQGTVHMYYALLTK